MNTVMENTSEDFIDRPIVMVGLMGAGKTREEMEKLPNDAPRELLGGIFDCLQRFSAENANGSDWN